MKNPKQKLKNILFLFASLVLVSCSEDLYETENTFNKQGIKIAKVSLKEPRFQNKTNLIEEVNKIKSKQVLASSTNRMVYDSINNFYFDDENGMLIENINGYESYTFKVERVTLIDSKLENVIFSKNQEGGYDSYLAKYPVSEEEIKALSTEEFENMETDFQMLNRSMAVVCITLTIYSGCNETHSNGVTCSGLTVTSDCYNMDGGSGGGGSSGGGSNTGGSGNGSVTGTTWQGGGVSTTPTGGGGSGNSSNMENFYSGLQFQQQHWLDEQTSETQQSIFNYLNTNGFTTANKNKIKQLINYFIQNPSINSEEFENWFLGIVEGKDAFYNDSFWQNTNLNFPQQQLPTWNNFNNSFPRNSDGTFMTGPNNVFGFVGGSVLQARIDNPDTTNNTCALKVSIALNGAGVVIPNIPRQTLQGGGAFAGKYFFLNAKALNNWMKLTFGTNPNNPNHHQFTQSQGGPNGTGFASALNNLSPNHGIFTMLPISAIEFGASGHCDIFDGTNCASHCYYDSASEINIWILP